MPFAVTMPQTKAPPLYLVRDPDGELMWDARKSRATPFTESEADQVVASITLHSSSQIEIVGVRNTVE